MSDQETLQEIINLKHALSRLPDASDSDEDYIGDLPTNRGNKLKRGARSVSCTVLRDPDDPLDVKLVERKGKKRAVVYNRFSKFSEEDLDGFVTEIVESDDSSSPDLLSDVRLDGLLKPITDPAEVSSHPAVSKTFNSTRLADMAQETLDIIVREKKHVTKLSNLLSCFLGDDPEILQVRNMNLPDFDHVDSGPAPKAENAQELPEGTVGITSAPALPTNGTASKRTNTRSQPAIDSFFATPDLVIDRNFGVSAESAEESRQLLQIAQQRLEEFIRSMTAIRSGFTKTDRRRRQILNWCKEINGQDYVEEEIGPDDQPHWSASQTAATSTRASATDRSE